MHHNSRFKVHVLTIFSLSLIVFSFLVDSPVNIIEGLKNILLDRDTLVTDYIEVGGIGAAFFNAGLLSLIFVFILYRFKIRINGATYAAIFTMAGFALFGKNLINVWFVIIGVYLYALIQKERFSRYLYIALFGTAMAPVATEFIFSPSLPTHIGLPLGFFFGILVGFILPPLSSHALKIHHGYSLYNVGFTSGLIGLVLVSILKSYGYMPESRFIYSSGNNLSIGIFLYVLFTIMLIYGFLKSNNAFKRYLKILNYSGRLVTDFVILEDIYLTLINMGLTGLISTSYVLLIGGELTGPAVGGILTIVGFSAFGKHPKNIIPIFIGVYIGSLTKLFDINDPSIILAALFGTSLAPIAGEFGIFYGILAGFIHSSVVLSIFPLHGGLILYNNGFSTGIVATFLSPIINAFRKDE